MKRYLFALTIGLLCSAGLSAIEQVTDTIHIQAGSIRMEARTEKDEKVLENMKDVTHNVSTQERAVEVIAARLVIGKALINLGSANIKYMLKIENNPAVTCGDGANLLTQAEPAIKRLFFTKGQLDMVGAAVLTMIVGISTFLIYPMVAKYISTIK
jgi:hypothetical protein